MSIADYMFTDVTDVSGQDNTNACKGMSSNLQHACLVTCTVHTDDRQSFTLHSLLARLAQGTSQQERVSASSACSISSCCLVCSGLHARYTDVFNVFLSIALFLVWMV